ncbi:ABC transporter substrate-binding protein [Fodinisporobacter ferrooxydans]|uniref:ABC transporter substrate-binding protein n=1 Tax=Fodinisporobacter ferrooxydans TaxID=2901836 RepID=A0ABY4CNR6_9BACL|nr:ABC transporter substrate-binding protein [Alicyclobacillaceae bacterium MYW30-H2]
MKKHMKQVMIMGLAGALAVGLVGCGSASSSTTATADSTTNASSKTGKPIEVTFWHGMSGQLGDVLKNMVDEFNKTHPDIHVNAIYQGSYSGKGPLQQKLLAAIASGKVPDIVQLEIHSIPVFAASGALQSLDSYMAQSTDHKKSDFIQGLLKSTSYKGQTYGVPFNRSVPVFYYNDKMFKAAGITEAPKTWDDVAKDAKLLTKKENGKTTVYGFEPVNQWWFFESLVWSGGGQLMNQGLTQATFDTPAAEAGMKAWQQMKKDGVLTVQTGPKDWDQTIADFTHGRAAMYVGSAGDMGQIEQSGMDFKASYVPMVKQYAVPTGGANAAILAKAPEAEKQAAWKFIEWFTAKEQTIHWSQKTGYMPVMKSAVDSQQMKDYFKQKPNHQVPVEELQYAQEAPLSPAYLQVTQYIQDAMDKIMVENANVDATLKDAVKKSNAAISQN